MTKEQQRLAKLNRYRHLIIVNSLIIFSFLVIAIVSFSAVMKSRSLFGAWDLQFHVRRLLELNQNFKHGIFLGQPAFNYFHGALGMVMYPSFNLYILLAIFRMIRLKVMTVSIFFTLNTFIALLVSYYSSYATYHSRKVSYLFAVLYTFTNYLLALYFLNFDIGAVAVYTYLPFVIFGMINFLKKGRWLELSTGVSLIILNHVLGSIYIITFLLIMFLLNTRLIDRFRMKALCRAVILTVCITSSFWVPALYYAILNHGQITSPSPTALTGYGMPFFTGTFKFVPSLHSMSVFSLIAVVLGFLAFKYFGRITKQFYVLSVIILIGCSDLIPWPVISQRFPVLDTFQKLYRFCVIPQMILIFIFALVIVKYFKWRKSILAIMMILVLGLAFENERVILHRTERYPVLTAKYVHRYPVDIMSRSQRYKLTKNNQLEILGTWCSYKTDYYPRPATDDNRDLRNIIKNRAQNGRHTSYLRHLGYNQFTFQNRYPAQSLRLPFVMYNGERVSMQIDHHPVPISNNHDQMILHHVNAGPHLLRINVQPNHFLDVLVYGLLLIGIIIYFL